jgi:SAM-dependent methyltransferase
MSSGTGSIAAYDLPRRVTAYDADMDLMHPNRPVMIEIALDFLPFAADEALVAVDLGAGTGYFTQRFLERFPRSRVAAIDGAAAMVDLARERLGAAASRVEFLVGDFTDFAGLRLDRLVADVVFSSYALHHLGVDDKLGVARKAASLLRAGGWFLNADVVVAESAEVEARIQELRVEGILARAASRAAEVHLRGADGTGSGVPDERFRDVTSTRRFLDQMEAKEGDQPLTPCEDLEVLRRAGLVNVSVLWMQHREMVSCGQK